MENCGKEITQII